jgi:hypothetical protein
MDSIPAALHSTPHARTEVGRVYGEYLVTYTSSGGQIRAYRFRKPDGQVEAHVSFPGGILASGVTDPYITDLWNYVREKGFAERFELILS